MRRHGPDGCVEPMIPPGDPAQMGQCGDHADGSVDAHVKRSHVVEEDHSGLGVRIIRFHQKRPDDRVVAPRFTDHPSAKILVTLPKVGRLLGDGRSIQVRSALDHDSSGFSFGVAVDHGHCVHV